MSKKSTKFLRQLGSLRRKRGGEAKAELLIPDRVVHGKGTDMNHISIKYTAGGVDVLVMPHAVHGKRGEGAVVTQPMRTEKAHRLLREAK